MTYDDEIDLESVGVRVKARRENLGLTQRELAERARLSDAYISRIENGIVKGPKLHDLAAVARALRMTIDELLKSPDQPGLTEDEQAEWDAAMSDPDTRYEFATTARSMRDWTDEEKRALLEVMRQMRDVIDRKRR